MVSADAVVKEIFPCPRWSDGNGFEGRGNGSGGWSKKKNKAPQHFGRMLFLVSWLTILVRPRSCSTMEQIPYASLAKNLSTFSFFEKLCRMI